MRKIFTLLIAITATLCIHAQTWNASTMEAGTYEDDSYVYEGLTIYADADKAVVIDGNSKSAGGYSFTQRIKMGGSPSWIDSSTPSGRVLGFEVTGDCKITVYAMSANSSATDRYVAVYTGDKTTTLLKENVLPTSLSGFSGTYAGDATSVFIASTNSGINIYGINVEYGGTKSFELKSNAKVISTLFYNINGAYISNQPNNLPKGVYIKKVKYNNGQIITTKVNRIF